MNKLITPVITAVLLLLLGSSCNSSTYQPGEDTAASVAIYDFGFQADNKVMAHLDTVFFSIDLINARIFNADSMPFGTNVTRLVPEMKTLDGVSLAEFTVRRSDGTDTVYNFITNPTDSIDFTNPVSLRIVSPDGMVSRTYTVNVNVHRMVSDSLQWNRAQRSPLPSRFAVPVRQRTASNDKGFYCLTTNGQDLCMAFSPSLAEQNWTFSTPALPAAADMNSLSGAGDALYILASGRLHKSTDGGASWTDTGIAMDYIYGAHGERLLGSAETPDGWQTVYGDGTPADAVPAGMPVRGTSQTVSLSFPMSTDTQSVFLGGECADGKLSGDVWGYDGNSWARISTAGLSGVREAVLVPFYSFVISNTLVPIRVNTLYAFGGTDGTGLCNTVYASNDYGMTWKKASALMQLPVELPYSIGAQAFVDDVVMTPSRATRPIEEWECPYIYLFGGRTVDGATYNTLWKGTVNRLSFKPLQ